MSLFGIERVLNCEGLIHRTGKKRTILYKIFVGKLALFTELETNIVRMK